MLHNSKRKKERKRRRGGKATSTLISALIPTCSGRKVSSLSQTASVSITWVQIQIVILSVSVVDAAFKVTESMQSLFSVGSTVARITLLDPVGK